MEGEEKIYLKMYGWPGFTYLPSPKIRGLYREIQMPANLTSANHLASFQGRKAIQIEVVNNISISQRHSQVKAKLKT